MAASLSQIENRRESPATLGGMRAGDTPDRSWVAIVGGGAAGMMTAIAAARATPGLRVDVYEGATRAGIKILASGGGRCNVTNQRVIASDFQGDRRAIARVLRRFDAGRAAAFFEELGVQLKHEPEFDKLFPVTDSARTVVDALLAELERLGIELHLGFRVTGIARDSAGFHLVAEDGRTAAARRLVLATGGKALPKSGSDGAAYAFVRELGHSITVTEPALVPLVLEPHPLDGLSGIAVPVEIAVWRDGRVEARQVGPMLITHHGVSGPAAMDASRHWSVGQATDRPVTLEVSFRPGAAPDVVEREWVEAARTDGGRSVRSLLADLPGRLAERLCEAAGVDSGTRLGQLGKRARRELLQRVTRLRLPVVRTRGFSHAEVTAGGVPLDEVDLKTMASRRTPDLYLVGELLDVDGRIGGFNFQWAWATGHVAGTAVATVPDSRDRGSV